MRHRVTLAVLLRPEKRAERAVHVANVRVVDRRVDDVRDDLGIVQRHAARVRCGAELVERRLAIEFDPFFERQALAVGSAFEQIMKRHGQSRNFGRHRG